MLDTNSVNYALDKITQTWMNVAPQIQNISEEYVKFVVTKQVASFIICFVMAIIGIPLLIKGINTGKKINYNDGGWYVPVIIGIVLTVVGVGFGFLYGYEAILAITWPEMFTIHEIIAGGK